MRTIYLIPILTLLLLTKINTLPFDISHRFLAEAQSRPYNNHHYLIECKEIEHTDDDYLCVEKQYEWVLEYVDI